MQFDSFSAFIAMGGYGFYVWLSFGACAFMLLLLILESNAGHKKIIKQIAQRQKREQKLRQAAEQNEQELTNDSKEVVS